MTSFHHFWIKKTRFLSPTWFCGVIAIYRLTVLLIWAGFRRPSILSNTGESLNRVWLISTSKSSLVFTFLRIFNKTSILMKQTSWLHWYKIIMSLAKFWEKTRQKHRVRKHIYVRKRIAPTRILVWLFLTFLAAVIDDHV